MTATMTTPTPTTLAPFARTARRGPFYCALAAAGETGGTLAVGTFTIPQGFEPPPHIHRREHEAFYLLDGTVTYFAGGQEMRAAAGDFVFLPRGMSHTFRIETGTMTALAILTPGGFERYFTMRSEGADRDAAYAFTETLGLEYVDGTNVVMPEADELRPFARRVGAEGARLFMGSTRTFVLATGAETGGEFALVEIAARKGSEPPPHIHHREAEFFYVLDGEMTATVGDETFRATPGTFVYLPQGVPHAYAVEGGAARWLAGILPGGFERFFRDLSAPADTLAVPPAPTAPPAPEQIERLMAVAAKYGIEFVM